MDFQLILYIIIVIVWLVLDNYRRIKKKQEHTVSRNTTSVPESKTGEKPYTTLEDILRDFSMEEEPEPVVERKPKPAQKQERPKPAPVKYETYESNINKDYKFSSEIFRKEVKPIIKGIDEIKKAEIGEQTGENKRRRKVDFDLRKAVIWSEILKRPYA
jgi:FtsZ-interacting cell division protein ZipA